MSRRIAIIIVGILVLVGVLGGIKGMQFRAMIAQGKAFVPPPEPVTTTVAKKETWESAITAVGSLVAVQGVTVSAEVPGKIVRVAFIPGSKVKAGDLLIQQDVNSETAQLRAGEASMALTRTTLDRAEKLLESNTISQSEVDAASAQYKQAAAQVENYRAIINKKTIRAPFAGRLGISLINLGQVLRENDPIVSLQSIDDIFVNFLVPQQQLGRLSRGLPVRITTDTPPQQEIEGKISAINPEIDSSTRNVEIQAILKNPDELLRPGMFVRVTVLLPEKLTSLVVPATSILYAPYGDSVFVVEKPKDETAQANSLVVRQQIVKLGETQGDFVAVTYGLKEGETVVSTGVFKLRNNQPVVVKNEMSPKFDTDPTPQDK